jgi:hypothetical protein
MLNRARPQRVPKMSGMMTLLDFNCVINMEIPPSNLPATDGIAIIFARHLSADQVTMGPLRRIRGSLNDGALLDFDNRRNYLRFIKLPCQMPWQRGNDVEMKPLMDPKRSQIVSERVCQYG